MLPPNLPCGSCMAEPEPEPEPEPPWTPLRRQQQQAAPALGFGSWDGAVQLQSAKLLEKLSADCKTVFSARTASDGDHSSGSTHWLAANAQPRCLLEQLALAILQAHAPPDEGSAAGGVGAEWWTLAIDAEDAAVGFHFDLDYEAEERCAVHRTPYAATVTYLCDTGVPTLVVEKAPTLTSRDGPPEDGLPIERGWLSAPAAGKHIRFRGAWLHGAPDLGLEAPEPEPEPAEASRGGKGKGRRGGREAKAPKPKGPKRKVRISLLVNVWLDGAPGLATPLPQAVAAKLSPCLSRVRPSNPAQSLSTKS